MTASFDDCTICLLGVPEHQVYLTWFQDSELLRRISIAPEWYDYVTRTPHIFAWMIYHLNEPVAVVVFEAEPSRSVAISMNPAARGRGYCKAVLRLVFSQPAFHPYAAVYGYIEPDNVASLRCAAGLSFAHISDELDEDGMLRVTFALQAIRALF